MKNEKILKAETKNETSKNEKKEKTMKISFQSIGEQSKIEQSAIRRKDFIYLFQISEEFKKKSESEKNKFAKKFRNKNRNKLFSLLDKIEIEAKMFYQTKTKKNKTDLNNSLIEFLKFYSETYINREIISLEKFSSLESDKQKRIQIFIEALKEELKTNKIISDEAKKLKLNWN